MSFCQINWFSNTLRKAIDTWVILPNQGDGPFPVFYLLHGISDDHTSWMRRSPSCAPSGKPMSPSRPRRSTS